MTTKNRLLELLIDHKKPDQDVDWERVQQILDLENPDSAVDWEEVQDLLGYSSLQAQAFLNSVNTEFGTKITPEDIMNATGTGGFLALLD